MKDLHGVAFPELAKMFSAHKKKPRKTEAPYSEMLFIREQKPKLNAQSDSIRAEVFTCNVYTMSRSVVSSFKTRGAAKCFRT